MAFGVFCSLNWESVCAVSHKMFDILSEKMAYSTFYALFKVTMPAITCASHQPRTLSPAI